MIKPRMYKLYAYKENGDALFLRLEHCLGDAVKTVLNHPMAASVTSIKFHGKKFTIADFYKLAEKRGR